MIWGKNWIDKIKIWIYKHFVIGMVKEEDLVDKIKSMKDLETLGKHGRVVLTNGGFSVIHYGHLQYLNEASQNGDMMVVAVNNNASIERIKGYTPPVSEEERYYHLASLQCVDVVIPFDGDTPMDIIKQVRPDVYVKGGDYSLDTINQEERRILEEMGVDIRFTKFHNGYSASKFVEAVRKIKFREEGEYRG